MTGVRILCLDGALVPEAVKLSQAVFGGSAASLSACFTNEANRFFAAVAEGRLVGFGGYSLAADQADVIDVAVAPSFRRQGIARLLMQSVLADASDRGAEAIFLEVRESNAGAIALYTALAFTACGVRKNYYANPRENAVLMTRSLAEYKSEKE